jgi:hypothetical protein
MVRKEKEKRKKIEARWTNIQNTMQGISDQLFDKIN